MPAKTSAAHCAAPGPLPALRPMRMGLPHPATADDIDMIKYLDSVGMNTVIVFTKCDKLNKTEREQRRMAFLEQLAFVPHIKTVEFSAHTGEGVEELRALIEAVAENN